MLKFSNRDAINYALSAISQKIDYLKNIAQHLNFEVGSTLEKAWENFRLNIIRVRIHV